MLSSASAREARITKASCRNFSAGGTTFSSVIDAPPLSQRPWRRPPNATFLALFDARLWFQRAVRHQSPAHHLDIALLTEMLPR